MAADAYTLEEAAQDIATLRGLVDKLTEILAQDDSTAPNTPTAGIAGYSAAGHGKYASADGNAYNTGRLTLPSTGALTLTSSLQTVPGLSASLAAGTYVFDGLLLISVTTGGGTMTYEGTCAAGLTFSDGRISFTELVSNAPVAGAEYNTFATQIAMTNALGTANRLTYVKGWGVVSVAGTLNIQAKLSSGSASILQYGTFLNVFPVT